jgi:mannose-6-phosphate isomerase-like protein (cupin superfamily)
MTSRLTPGGGDRVWFLGNLMTIKQGLGEGDASSFILGDLEAHHAPPVHVHEHEAESFYVLSGTVRFHCGGEEFEAGPEDFVTVPARTPHAFRIGASGARMLMLSTSSLLARFMAAGGVPASDGPAPPASPADLERVSRLAAAYDMTIVGPPLT